MGYKKQNFTNFDYDNPLTAEQLINMEEGIIHYNEAPSDWEETFTFQVDTEYGDVLDLRQTVDIQDTINISTDTACIMLPKTYDPSGEPVKLVIMNRGAGEDYYSTKNYPLNKALLAAGFATLHVRGIPVSFQNDLYINSGYGAPYGSPIFMRCVVAAYNYVVNKYNIDRGGCGVFGVSCGGLQTINLTNANVLPIAVVALDAPVIDLHNDCYFNGGWTTGKLGGKTSAGVAWMYQFDYCDFEAGTYTIDGTTYEFAVENSTALEKLWQLNKKRVEMYNPYDTSKYIVDVNGENITYGFKFPCPVKCWFASNETVNSPAKGMEFIERCRVGGTIAEFRSFPSDKHCTWTQGTNVNFNGLSIPACSAEMALWLSRWLGKSDKNFGALA